MVVVVVVVLLFDVHCCLPKYVHTAPVTTADVTVWPGVSGPLSPPPF